jgi:hypothetical protein
MSAIKTNLHLQSEISVCRIEKGKTVEVMRNVTISRALDEIQSGRFKSDIEVIRRLVSEHGHDDDKVKSAKMNLPAYIFSGKIDGAVKQAMEEKRFTHSGLIQLDFDHIQNADEIRDQIAADPFTLAAWVSPSGTGVKGLCIVPKTDKKDDHKKSFEIVGDYFKTKYNLDIDQACKNANRLCYAGYDPDLKINDQAREIDHKPRREQLSKQKKKVVGFTPPPHEGINEWLPKAAWERRKAGMNREQAEADLLTYDGTMRRSFQDNEVSRALDLAYKPKNHKAQSDYFHAPSATFLVQNAEGRWLPLRSEAYKRYLKVVRGLYSSEDIDQETVRIQMENDVARYGALCGQNSGFYDKDGARILVTENMNLIEPIEGTFPTIASIVKGLLVASEESDIAEAQTHTFFGWLKSSVEALRAGRYQQQQALAICGIADCGKSLIQHQLITPCLAGRSADAMRYFLRDNDFNANLFAAEHLFLDDCRTQSKISTRLAFGEKIKTHTVGATIKSLHSKGKDEISVKPWWRITITLNDDPESLMVLPPLNENFDDKLIILRASRFDFPMPVTSTEEKEKFAQKIKSEIPAFLFWLINKYQIPEKYADPRRYNVATFHHPYLKRSLESLAPEYDLLDLIDVTLEQDLSHGQVWISAEKLEERIRQLHPRRAEQVFTFRQSCGKYLQRLSVKEPLRIRSARTASERGWLITPKNDGCDG